jgi:transcriptional regulator with XRE-family HTH domain
LTIRITPHYCTGMAIDGAAVRVLREKDGYTATAFAEKLGISLTYLGDIESGRRTLKRNPELIGRIAETLNVPRSMIEQRVGTAAG